MQSCAINLADGGRRKGIGLELREHLVELSPSVGLDHLAHLIERDPRGRVAQLRELGLEAFVRFLGSAPVSTNEATCPIFIAAPFIWPSTSRIRSAACSCRLLGRGAALFLRAREICGRPA